jgi:uncharacterized membrane protein YkgB
MALRLPIPARNVRRPSRFRRTATIIASAVVLVVLPLRIVLAALSVATWTSAWKTVNLITVPMVWPFRLIGFLDREIGGRLLLADVVALLVLGGITLYMLAMLTVRRQR